MLTYRPPSVYMLSRMLGYMSRKDAEESFARNTQCYILQALDPKFKREMYSEYAGKLKKHNESEETTPEKIKEKRTELLRKLNEG